MLCPQQLTHFAWLTYTSKSTWTLFKCFIPSRKTRGEKINIKYHSVKSQACYPHGKNNYICERTQSCSTFGKSVSKNIPFYQFPLCWKSWRFPTWMWPYFSAKQAELYRNLDNTSWFLTCTMISVRLNLYANGRVLALEHSKALRTSFSSFPAILLLPSYLFILAT